MPGFMPAYSDCLKHGRIKSGNDAKSGDSGSRRIRGPDAAGDLCPVLTLNQGDIVLALQVEPELRAVAEVPA